MHSVVNGKDIMFFVLLADIIIYLLFHKIIRYFIVIG